MLDGRGAQRRAPDRLVPYERQLPGQSFAISKNWLAWGEQGGAESRRPASETPEATA